MSILCVVGQLLSSRTHSIVVHSFSMTFNVRAPGIHAFSALLVDLDVRAGGGGLCE